MVIPLTKKFGKILKRELILTINNKEFLMKIFNATDQNLP